MQKQAIILMMLLCILSPMAKAHENKEASINQAELVAEEHDFFDELESLEAPPLPKPEESYWFTPYARNAGIRLFLYAEKFYDNLLALYAACPCIFRTLK